MGLKMVVGALVAVALGTMGATTFHEYVDDNGSTFRLRATATFLVDGVERSGSSVQEFRLVWNSQPHLGNTGAWRLLARGEGVRVDVPGSVPIYVQLSSDIVFYSCAELSQGQDVLRQSLLDLEHCKADILPTAIRFRSGDLAKPEVVYAGNEDRNGYRFLGMQFDRSEDEITSGRIGVDLRTDQRGYIWLHYDGLTDGLGLSSFKSEEFR